MSVMEQQQQQSRLPIFNVYADEGSHPAVQLDRPICVIGRREGTNLPLDAEQVSKFHALIVREASGVYLRDLASTNGVQLNGQQVSEAELSDEDTIRIGAFTLQCVSGFSVGREASAAHENALTPEIELVADGKVTAVPPGRNSFIIGRRPGCDVRLSDASVAPVHAAIFKVDGQWMVRAFSTAEGTKLNGASVHQSALKVGDALTVGPTTFTIQLNDSASVTSDDSLFDSDIALGASALHTSDDSLAADALSSPGLEPVTLAEPLSEKGSEELDSIHVGVSTEDAARGESANDASGAHDAVAIDSVEEGPGIQTPFDAETVSAEDDSWDGDIVSDKASRFSDNNIVDASAAETNLNKMTPDLMDDSGLALQGELVDSSLGHASFTGEVIAERKGADAPSAADGPIAPVAPKMSSDAPRDADVSSEDRQESNVPAQMSGNVDDLLPVEHDDAAAIPLSMEKEAPPESDASTRDGGGAEESTTIANAPADPSSDARLDTENAGASTVPETIDLPPEERVEVLVEEIAGKAASLKEAWEELTTAEDSASTDAGQGRPVEKKKRAPRKSGARRGRKSK